MAKKKTRPFAKPMSFRDIPIEAVLAEAKQLSDLKNLGPETEKSLHKAGIRSVPQFMKLGWKEVMKKLVQSNPKNRHSIFAYAIIGATQNIFWNKISEEDKRQAREFMATLKPIHKKKAQR